MDFNLSTKLNHHTKYLISVSGGVDSMVLLDYLYSHNFFLTVVHFNHLKRDESILDKHLVESFCKEKNIPFYYFELHLDNDDFQNKARIKRKEHLLSVANSNHIKNIITAHHLDDLAETILMKISRGSSLLGYSGMMPSYVISDITYLKPLLYTPKKDILSYAKENNIPYLEDRTNKEDHYFRNRIRHHVIPILSNNGSFDEQIIRYHKQVLNAYTFIRKQTLLFLNDKKEIDNLDAFLNLDDALQSDIILYLLECYHVNKTYDLIHDILDILKKKLKPNLTLSLENDLLFVKSYNKAFIIDNQYFKLNHVKPELLESNILTNIKGVAQEICYNILDYPLNVRKRQNGDVLKFSFGHKKLKDFLIDKKIPQLERDQLWLVVDSNNQIIWIPNLYVNKTLGNQNKTYLSLWEE